MMGIKENRHTVEGFGRSKSHLQLIVAHAAQARNEELDDRITIARKELQRAYAVLNEATGDYVDVAVYRVRAAEAHCNALRAQAEGKPFPLYTLPWVKEKGVGIESDKNQQT